MMLDSAWWGRLFAAIDSKDTAAFLEFLAPDAEFRFANAPVAQGHAAIGAMVSGFFGIIGGSRHRLIRSWKDADTAVCEGEVTYTRLDGSTLTLPFANVFYLRGERIGRYLIFIDNSALFS